MSQKYVLELIYYVEIYVNRIDSKVMRHSHRSYFFILVGLLPIMANLDHRA